MSLKELQALTQKFADAFDQRDFKAVTQRDNGIAPKSDKVFPLSRIENADHNLNKNSQI